MTRTKQQFDSSIPYERIEYIEGTGTQWLNTNLIAPNGFECFVEVAYMGSAVQPAIIGSHNQSTPWGRNHLYIEDLNYSYPVFSIGTGNTYHQSELEVKVGEVHSVHFSTVKGNSFLEVDGQMLIESADSSERSANVLQIGKTQYTDVAGQPTAKMRFYRIQVIVDGEMRFDGVPVLADDEGCLYDTVSKTLFKNAGTGKFVVGR